jgi:hypothetical protein
VLAILGAFQGERSMVLLQAEKRLHAHKVMLKWLMIR